MSCQGILQKNPQTTENRPGLEQHLNNRNTFCTPYKTPLHYLLRNDKTLFLRLSKKTSENFSCVTFEHKCFCLIGGAWHRVSEAFPVPRALHEK